MPTVLSWTEWHRAASDLRALLAFRSSAAGARSRRRVRLGLGLVGTLTLVAAVLPAFLRAPLHESHSGEAVALLPSMYLGFFVLTLLAAVAAGGGREVVPGEQAVAYPVSSTTEHLGALLMAPLNIAWLLQCWTVLGVTAYALGPRWLPLSLTPVVAWILASTALAQAAGWLLEWVRRGRGGVVLLRVLGGVVAVLAVLMVVTHRTTHLLDHSPTVGIFITAALGSAASLTHWGVGVGELLLLAVVAVVVGAIPARWALHRAPRAELRLESGIHPARRGRRTDLSTLCRLDRGSVLRSVPLRRGVIVLAVMPGLVALGGGLHWDLIPIMPGLVASGGALLFGVNAWCLDGRGVLWRESLPVAPTLVFWARALILAQILLASMLVTVVLAVVRAGPPTPVELAALAGDIIVVLVQVVAAAMRWSVARPFSVDLRSARATPAPPVVMVGYSARLALVTTCTGLAFSAAAAAPSVRPALGFVLVMVAWSGTRLALAAGRFARPEVRSLVAVTVAG